MRTEGIYTIMITLAIAAAFFYFTMQNWADLQRLYRLQPRPAPHAFGVDWRSRLPLYYLILFFAALCYLRGASIFRARRSGLRLQGVRDNPRRMAAIGFNVTAHRIAAYAFAALIASIGGILHGLEQQSDLAGFGRRRARHRHSHHRRRRRHRPSDRPVHRRAHLRDAAHLRARFAGRGRARRPSLPTC